jgi:mono/diheme cytochrome c family protein
MMRRFAILIGLVASVAVGACPVAASESEETLIARGRALALSVCAPCHVVAPGQPPGGPLLKTPGPSFDQIANSDAAGADSLRVFLSSPHANMGPHARMANPRLADYQIERLVAYIMSLRRTR